ncbi:MAG: glycosyltransferase family 29 protein [Clostridia bacterium]|nr:glycosyltransferase family 29 protein [Clostridia bacterium]
MKKVIIIGNGSSVLDKKNGEIINSFDIVVRVNDFRIDGYEEYVGNKTDILVTFAVYRLENIKAISEKYNFKRILIFDPYDMCKKDDPLSQYNLFNSIKNKTYTTQILNRTDTWIEMSQHHYRHIPWSTGLVAIWTLLKEYDHIYITGFDYFREDRERLHYFDTRKICDTGVFKNGYIKDERFFLENLIKENKITFI